MPELDRIHMKRSGLNERSTVREAGDTFLKVFMILDNALAELSMCLTLFESHCGYQLTSLTIQERDEMSEAIRQIEDELTPTTWPTDFRERWELEQAIRLNARIKYGQYQWANGEIPRSYKMALPGLYARAFVYSLDRISNLLRTLPLKLTRANETWTFLTEEERSDLKRTSDEVNEVWDWFKSCFPELRDVRNSSAHIEDRLQFLSGKKDKKTRQPIPINVPRGPGLTSVMSETLLGNKLTSLLSDGTHGSVAISAESLDNATSAIQAAINAFHWGDNEIPYAKPLFP